MRPTRRFVRCNAQDDPDRRNDFLSGFGAILGAPRLAAFSLLLQALSGSSVVAPNRCNLGFITRNRCR